MMRTSAQKTGCFRPVLGTWFVLLLWLLGAVSVGWAKPGKTKQVAAKKAIAHEPVDASAQALAAAQAAQAAGRVVEAHDRVRRLLASADAELRLSPAQREQAQAILATARPEAGEVVVLGEPSWLVRVDEQDVARLPLPVPLLLSVGSHAIEFVGGSAPLRVQVQVRAGRRMEVRANREAGAVMVSQPPHALLVAAPFGLSLPQGQRPDTVVERGLRGSPLVLLSSPSDLAQELARCNQQAACLAEIAQRSQAEYVLVVRVSEPLAASSSPASAPAAAASEPGADRSPASVPADRLLRVTLLDPFVVDAAAHVEERCAACTPDVLAERLAQLVERVNKQGFGRPRARVRIRVEPADAELSLNGISLGALPVERSVWAGELRIQARRAGYLPLLRAMTLSEGSNEALDLTLEPVPPPNVAVAEPSSQQPAAVLVERQPRPRWRLATGALAVAAGATLIGFGVGALQIHGSCIDVVQPPATQCERLYQTATLGTTLVSVGAVSALAGVVLLAVPGPRRPRHAAQSRP